MEGPEAGVSRSFYQLPPAAATTETRPGRSADPDALRQYVREQIIGRESSFLGPYGANRAVYCDHTASSKGLHFIENYIRDEVLATYSSTHTTSTNAALQTTSFRDEARQLVRSAVQASEHDAVLFCGSGATGAVHKLLAVLRLPQAPLVLVGPHEHHSNLLPWREIAHQVVRVAEDPATGAVSLSDLQTQLARLTPTERPLVACFSAASNVTGLLAPHAEITAAVHRHGGLCVWDYATAGPYTEMLMNPVIPGLDAGLTQKDALFFSPHKMIGGVQTPGVLVVKKRLVRNTVPAGAGGGTVFFVRRDSHRYLQDIESREEGGTPGIVESIRAGLVLQLKEALGPERIRLWDDAIVSRFLREVRSMPQLALLGPRTSLCPRLPVFSFLVATPVGGFLHHNFVAALLNDLLGVQTRGGCACAGPYAQDLLGIDEQLAERYEHILAEDSRLDRTHLRRQGEYSSYELLRPGFTRLTLSYLLTEDELEHAISALRLVCEHGWKLLPQYRVNPETGEWRHHSNLVLKERRWLGDIKYTSGAMEVRHRTSHPAPPADLAACLVRAREHVDNAVKMCPRHVPDHSAMFDGTTADLRWFLLPNEAQMMLHGATVTLTPPFKPRVYGGAGRGPLGRRRAMSESGESKPPPAGSSGPPSPRTPPTTPPTAPGVLYSGSLDRDRSRPARPPPTAAVDAGRALGRQTYMKQRAMSVSCGSGSPADRRLSDTRFLAQELHNLFFSGARPAAPSAAMVPGPPSPTARAAAVGRSSPDGAESRAAAGTEVPSAAAAAAAAARRPPLRTRSASGTIGVPPSLTPPIATSATATTAAAAAVRVSVGVTGSPVSSPLASPSVAVPSPTGGRRVVAVSVLQWPSPPADRSVLSASGEAAETARDGLGLSDRVCEPVDELGRPSVRPPAGSLVGQAAGDSPSPAGCGVDSRGTVSLETKLSELRASAGGGGGDLLHKDSSEVTSKVPSVAPLEALSCETLDPQRQPAAGGKGDSAPTAAELRVQTDVKAVESQQKVENAVESRKTEKKTEVRQTEKKADVVDTGPKWHAPPKNIFKKTAEAIEEFSMLRAGDRVLVCLSGGKDSLSLLHVLRQYRFVAASRGAPFELAAVTVDPQSSQYDPRPLIPYLAKLGVPYYYEVQGILQQAEAVDCSSICSFCSRMKRGRLYAAARRQGYNVLAFGQHLDDISESFLMSVFHNGRLRTMKACYSVTEEDLRVIRPLIYVREKELRHFAMSRKLPIIPENCPACFEEPKERHRVKQLLAHQEVLFPHLFESLRSALRPLYAISRTGLESRLFGRASGGVSGAVGAVDVGDVDSDEDDDVCAVRQACGGDAPPPPVPPPATAPVAVPVVQAGVEMVQATATGMQAAAVQAAE